MNTYEKTEITTQQQPTRDTRTTKEITTQQHQTRDTRPTTEITTQQQPTRDTRPTKEIIKDALHDVGEKVGLVKPETNTTTIKEVTHVDGTRSIEAKEKHRQEYVGFGKGETDKAKIKGVVDNYGNASLETKEGRDHTGLFTHPQTLETKQEVTRDAHGNEIKKEVKGNPEHVGLFKPETQKIKTKEEVRVDPFGNKHVVNAHVYGESTKTFPA